MTVEGAITPQATALTNSSLFSFRSTADSARYSQAFPRDSRSVGGGDRQRIVFSLCYSWGGSFHRAPILFAGTFWGFLRPIPKIQPTHGELLLELCPDTLTNGPRCIPNLANFLCRSRQERYTTFFLLSTLEKRSLRNVDPTGMTLSHREQRRTSEQCDCLQ